MPLLPLSWIHLCTIISYIFIYIYRAGSIGVLLPGNEARIVDPDSGADLECNQPGEILVKSLAVMKGKIYNFCLSFYL